MLLCGLLPLPAAGCSRFDILNALVPSGNYLRTSNVAYGDRPRQNLDVYRPRSRAKSPPARGRGVVIFIYGGSWDSGSKSDYRFVAQALTSRGFIAVLPDYRLYPKVAFPAFVEDAAKAVRWSRDNVARFGGDVDRIYLMGHSAGAHIAALLTLDEHYLKDAGVDPGVIRATAALSGPYDFVPGPDTRGVFRMSAGESIPDARIQPINFVDGNEPPMLLIHGAKDNVVDPSDTAELAAKIRQAGGSVRTIIYPKRGHAGTALALASPFRRLAPVLRDVTAFFAQQGKMASIKPE